MQKKKFRLPRITTVIGTGTCIKGDLLFSGSIHVDGTVHGNVIADKDEKSTLVLSEKGRVEGDVRVPNAFLNGKVVGDVRTSRRVELDSNARVTGTLYYKLLEMAMGAEVNGQLVRLEDAAAAGAVPPGRDVTDKTPDAASVKTNDSLRTPADTTKDNS